MWQVPEGGSSVPIFLSHPILISVTGTYPEKWEPNALSVLVSRIQQIDMAESMNLQVLSPSCKQCNKLKELKYKVYGF